MIMAIEIERKFSVKGISANRFQIRTYHAGIYLLTTRTDGTDTHPGEEGFLTIKGASDENGLSRYEFEQKIPPADAEELLKLCEPGIIDKVRNCPCRETHLGSRRLPRRQRRTDLSGNRIGF